MAGELSRLCPVCGGGSFSPCLQKGTLRLVRCHSCSMVFANPVPSCFATGDYYDSEGTSYYLSPAKLESDYSPVRFERELGLFTRHCSGGPVLDVGCSSGAFLYQLKTRYSGRYDVVGTDVSGAPLDHAGSRGIRVLRGDFSGMDLAGERFAAVTFWAVLEHLPDPARFLAKAAAVLEPGGICVVLVPNMNSLAARVLGARYRYIYDQHLNYFTRRTLHRLVSGQWEVLETRSMHFNPVVIWQDWRSGGREVANAERASLLQRTTALKQSRWIGPVKVAYRLAESMLGGLALADNLAVVLRRSQ